MRALLDVNVLIALLDADHVSHDAATSWFEKNARRGWASCPITQNGCVRVMCHPGYPNAPSPQTVIERLAAAAASEVHEFWPDEISLLDQAVFDPSRIHGPRQITDLYLLALAVKRGGRLVTFNGAIARAAAKDATDRHLVIL